MGGYSNCCCSDSTSTSEEVCPLTEFIFEKERKGFGYTAGSSIEGFNAWYYSGAVEIRAHQANDESYCAGPYRDFALIYSTDVSDFIHPAISVINLRTALGSDKGNGSFAGWTGRLNGKTDPWPFPASSGSILTDPDFPNDYQVTSALFTDFIWFGGKQIYFDWGFLTNEISITSGPPLVRPILSKDFCFVSIQRQGSASPSIFRLCDTDDVRLEFAAETINGGSGGVSTKKQRGTIMLPGATTEGVYRIAFGCCNVHNEFLTSALSVSNLGCWDGSSSSTSEGA